MISIKRLKSPQNSVSYQAVHFNMGCPGDSLAFGASSGRLRNWIYFCVGLIFQTWRSPQTQLIAFCCIMGFIRSVGPGARPASGRKSGCLRDLLRHFPPFYFFFDRENLFCLCECSIETQRFQVKFASLHFVIIFILRL